jgi:predicted DNA-binding protein
LEDVLKTFTVRLDEQFYKLLESLSQKTNKPKSNVVKEALLTYRRELEKQELLRNLVESAKELAKELEELEIW